MLDYKVKKRSRDGRRIDWDKRKKFYLKWETVFYADTLAKAIEVKDRLVKNNAPDWRDCRCFCEEEPKEFAIFFKREKLI
jgi:hypothetical protein